jgi:plastocyanin
VRGQSGGLGSFVRAGALTTLLALIATTPAASAQVTTRPPTPEPNAAVDISPRPCALEGRDKYEREFYAREGWGAPDYERYPGNCQRLRFSYGPIAVKPGQNDVLIEPVKIEKPLRDGYITRFKPDLVRADGTVPPIEQVHLHHGTWLSVPDYGSGPFFAAGEEKTTAPFPKGYGMPVKATDQWLLLYMVHSAVQQPMEVYITYDIDFIPKDKGDALGLKNTYPIWFDVRPSSYPVFNVQRDFGGADGTCTWPAEKCAAHDPYGKELVGQGQPGNGKGTDWEFPKPGESLGLIEKFNGGTIIGLGGHLHPGGLRNTIDLVRPGNTVTVKKKVKVKSKKKGKNGKRKTKTKTVRVTEKREEARIYTGEAVYWDRKDQSKGGGPPTSWDFSMKVTGLPTWGVHVKPGDKVRSNAIYDTTHQSTYENMGIVVSLFVPNDENGRPQAPGVDPYTTPLDPSGDCKSGGLEGKKKRLCDKGIVTHGHLAENDNFGGAQGEWKAPRGVQTDRVAIADFIYAPGDLSMISMTGVPTVKMGSELTFTNFDGPVIYHTITSCKFPCLGPTGTAFPLSDGQTSKGRNLDYDSSELGFGAPAIGPAKQTVNWSLPVTKESGFEPGEISTYFCRIHPGMRGAFEVQE